MKSYDDLQRFKEKTQTNHIDFKDMSGQTKNADSANWAIIKQLMNNDAETALGNGQRVDVAAPQPIAKETFSAPVAPPPQAQGKPSATGAQAQPADVTAFISAKPAEQPAGSLLDTISASLKPAQAADAPAETASQQQPEAPPAPTQTAAASMQTTAAPHLLTPQAPFTRAAQSSAPFGAGAGLSVASPPPAAAPAQPAWQSAAPSADLPRFKQLFSPAPATSLTTLPKQTLLHPLLERIALCR